MRVITVEQLREVLRFEDLIEPVAKAFAAYSRAEASSEMIVMFPGETPEAGDVYVKTGTMVGSSTYVVKVSPWFAGNAAAGRPQGGFVAVFDAATGYTTAIIEDKHLLSDLRTAAAGAIVARFLAPSRVRTALVVGTGTQALLQPQALAGERTVERLLVWGRHPGRAGDLARRLEATLLDVEVTAVSDLRSSVEAADVILMCTAATRPLLLGDWLRPGQHVTSVGSDDHTKAELDAACLLRADRVIVDSIAGAAMNGSIHRHLTSGAIGQNSISGEIGQLVEGLVPGRKSDDEVTIAALIGLGVQDLAAASVAVRAVDRTTDQT